MKRREPCWVTRPAGAHLFRPPSLPPSGNDSLYFEAEAAAELTFRFLSSSPSSPISSALSAYPESLRSSTTHVYVSSARIETQSHSLTLSRVCDSACGNLYILTLLVGVASNVKCLLMFWCSIERFRIPLSAARMTCRILDSPEGGPFICSRRTGSGCCVGSWHVYWCHQSNSSTEVQQQSRTACRKGRR